MDLQIKELEILMVKFNMIESTFSVITVVLFFVLADLRTPEAYVNAQTFYDDLGTLAHQNGYKCTSRSRSLMLIIIYFFQCHGFTSYHQRH